MSRRSLFVSGVCALWLLACGAAEPRAQVSPGVAPEVEAPGEPSSAEATPSSEPPAPAPPPTPADPPLTVDLRGEVADGVVTPVIEVRGGTARLSASIVIEREDAGRYAPLEGVGTLALRASCEEPISDCVEVVEGAELRPPAWLGTVGDAQCICTRCGPAPAGTYRFVLTSCDGRQRVEGAPFELPER